MPNLSLALAPERCVRATTSATLALALALANAPVALHAQSAAPAVPAVPRSHDTASLPLDDATFAARVDSVFAPWRGSDRPGCAVGVSHRGRVVVERAYGMADLESGAPMTPAAVVHSASLAKQVTALAVLLLVRDGKLSLDDDVQRWLPELPDYRARTNKPITVRHLLTHTSGLRDFFELLILARGRFEEERITDADATAVVKRQRDLNFAPGAEYGYSNTNYLLAAKIVERVSRERFATYVASRIFTPLGMTHSHLRDDVTVLVPGRAVGYTKRGDAWRTSTPNYDVVGPTNLETTVGDLLRLAENLERPTVGDSAIARQMLTPGRLASGDSTTYGLGLSLVRDRGFRVAEHEGRDPGFRAYLGRWLDPKLSVALLCNSTALNPVGLGRDVGRLALGAPAQTSSSAPASPAAPGDTTKALAWAGMYMEPTTKQISELTVRNGVLITDGGEGARIEAIDARRARLVDEPMELEFDSATPHPAYTVHWTIPYRRADRFVWRAPVAPRLGRTELAAYAGTYTSTELDATYRVIAGDSTLTLRTGETPGLVARAVFPDGFVSGQYTIQFVREGGRVTGFEISHPRARGVAFVRAAPVR
jgi:CubicO group peptidase (beta-lactamase class C family)